MKKRYKISRVVAIILLLMTGINATFAGLAFIFYPNGAALGISQSVLQYSPFPNFLIPGIVLLIVNGICNIVVAVLTIHRKRYYSTLISFQGIILVGWLILQVYFTGNQCAATEYVSDRNFIDPNRHVDQF